VQIEKNKKLIKRKSDENDIKILFSILRDLALSSFNSNYVANDLHVVRVITRTGLLNYGFDLLENGELETGNNPFNKKIQLFFTHTYPEIIRTYT
jgi:hypothetical protein